MKILGKFYFNENNHSEGGFILTECKEEYNVIVTYGHDIKGWKKLPHCVEGRMTISYDKWNYCAQQVVDSMFYNYNSRGSICHTMKEFSELEAERARIYDNNHTYCGLGHNEIVNTINKMYLDINTHQYK